MGIPCWDGIFDVILVSETTYSEAAAMDTARLKAGHLRPHTGVAYVAAKRYYFGVQGRTGCLVDALKGTEATTARSFDIQVLRVYDNGGGNIRELLLIKDA